MSLGELILPVLIVYLLSIFYWRELWLQISIVVLLTLPFVCLFTIKDISIQSREQDDENIKNNLSLIKNWTRKESKGKNINRT